MPTRIRAADACNSLAEILGRAHFDRETFPREKQDEPSATLTGIHQRRSLPRSLPQEAAAPPGPEPDGPLGRHRRRRGSSWKR